MSAVGRVQSKWGPKGVTGSIAFLREILLLFMNLHCFRNVFHLLKSNENEAIQNLSKI